jgi:hypothetical protein
MALRVAPLGPTSRCRRFTNRSWPPPPRHGVRRLSGAQPPMQGWLALFRTKPLILMMSHAMSSSNTRAAWQPASQHNGDMTGALLHRAGNRDVCRPLELPG